jgi:hypothetical protein
MDAKAILQKKIENVNQMQFLCFLPGVIFLVTGADRRLTPCMSETLLCFAWRALP